jgi:methionyl-tRNA synthetase
MYSSYEENPEEKPYYITTAIDYPNAPPHVGHSLEKVAADVIARYHRLQGFDTYFSMGLDENSQHVVQAAQANNVDLVTWINKMDQAFRLAWSKLEVSYDRSHRVRPPLIVRTTFPVFCSVSTYLVASTTSSNG